MIPVILSGGSGTRLWPVSRQQMPKQFCDIFGKPLQTYTLERSLRMGTPWIITSKALQTLPELNLKQNKADSVKVIYEPLVPWIWFGGGVVVIGAIVCGWPSTRRRRAIPQIRGRLLTLTGHQLVHRVAPAAPNSNFRLLRSAGDGATEYAASTPATITPTILYPPF